MVLKIIWTQTAISQLKQIFTFYQDIANTSVAQRIIDRIIERAILLETYPNVGQKEELLKTRANDYHYLIEGNFKIIYWIDKDIIKIASVFDCRKDPSKLESEI